MNLTLAENRYLRLVTLCGLYVAQGIPFGFVTITLAGYFAEEGLGAQEIGSIVAMSSLPWAFKWVWGPFIDRFSYRAMGNRRPWILLAQVLMAVTIGALVVIPDLTRNIVLLGWMVFVHNLFSSLQDVSVDALAVDLLREDERGKANGLMYGSSWAGTAIGGAGLTTVLGWSDMRTALGVQVSLLLVIMLLPLLFRERPGEKLAPWTAGRASPRSRERAVGSIYSLFKALGKAFSLRSPLLSAGFGLWAYVGSGLVMVIKPIFLIQTLGWDKQEFANIEGGVGLALGLAGSVLGGFLADAFGAKRVIRASSVVLGLTWIVFAGSSLVWETRPLVYGIILLEVLCTGLLSVALFSLFMTVSWPRVAATQFTAYMAILNLARTLGQKVSGTLEAAMSMPAIYYAMGVSQIACVVLLGLIDPGQTRRLLGEGRGDVGERQ
jgi:PAT family beta-lactamase induction signal transducer AmpG